MMKKIISLLLALMLCAVLATTVAATEAEAFFVFDDAELLTDSQASALAERLEEISKAYNAQVVVVTIDSLDGESVDEYLEFAYDAMGFGYGQNNDGVMLLVCMDPREYRILSNGFAAEAIDPDTIDVIGDAFVSDLSDGNYADAFNIFADKCEYYLNGHLNGFPFDTVKALLIALGVGLLLGFIITKGWKNQLKSVQKQNKANAYVKMGSMQITQSGDYFMYRNVTKTKKQSSSSSGSGGSSRSTGGGSF